MKSINKFIHLLLLKLGFRTIITVTVHNNYIVYCKSNQEYYNLLPLKIGQIVWGEFKGISLRQFNIINTNGNNHYQILDIFKFFNDQFANGDELYPYLIDTELIGYAKGKYFIVTGTE